MHQKPVDVPQIDDVTVHGEVTHTENATDTKENLIIELENCDGAPKCDTNGGQKSDSQQSCSSATAKPVQYFKNVVAIVDPPRVGLHPTVSSNLKFM